MTAVLSLDRLGVRRRADGAALVTDVSLAVEAGGTLGIVGESGSGKSLTLRAALGILPPTLEATGGIRRDGRAAMVFQEPATALNPTLRVGSFVAGTWRRHHPGASRAAARAATVDLLAQVGIADPAARTRAWPHELSGGMRQRVMIAAALATDPRVLLCDEPTTALDVRVQARILALLRGLIADRGMALVFVSHDLAVVASVCARIAVMRAGSLVEEGPAARVLTEPRHPYTRELLEANLARRLAARPKESA
ncbi:ABC transporter ATP-binding protein [Actinocorallia sp. API 0066]|uniref:ABC transporter ATP-binding protein n=1 Tax=Actinocorallia sp. API 0066 TaxID=2896846 RepID=UPI001E2A956B|nr:ABC transporter ATP-binding protein [Actinocorallia sp. API 0066]MCD0449713.1 ABC transporter ATP-binding protein [Actinocorallia sp. API 0066]